MRDTSEIREFFDGMAPRWDAISKETHDQLAGLLETLPLKEGMSILDVGCGTGIISGLLQEMTDGNVQGIDLSPNMIQIARAKHHANPHIRFDVGDFSRYQADEPADMVILFNAYPHFLDLEGLKKSLLRNLKTGGYFVILHSISRARLSSCHSGREVHVISRDLGDPSEEASFYAPEFDCLRAEESDSHYLVTLIRK